ncbi:EamA family transporter [Goodfellowiella coeruleoviolacea]|uniref:EamA-like transporter family protein n=1 Tax=Goodfellowiella coeruleoviolacea TaxID=334858 RepID=A0AAE3GFD9_9PSEU|nr:EamA family transporter [Goodfellowiella coeruleoviolacea]MCP2165148.1 EamA-like transporter family protein [Goodfellowiella coeruleoviolacea]
MSPLAVALVLAAACAHAGWNLFAKRAGDGGVLFVWLTSVTSLVVYLPVAAVTALVDPVRPGWTEVLVVGVSAGLHLVYFVLLQRGYAVGDMSVVYPLARGTGPLFTVLVSVLLLDERPGALGLAGAAAVVLGVFVIGWGSAPATSGRTRWGGAAFGVLTGVVITLYTLWDAHAVTTLTLSPLLLDWGNNLGRTLLVAPHALRRRAAAVALWRAQWRTVLAVGVLSPLAYILVLFAMRLAPVSLVAPARELSIVVGGVAAWLLLGEPNPLRRLTGAAIVLAGVAAIAVS